MIAMGPTEDCCARNYLSEMSLVGGDCLISGRRGDAGDPPGAGVLCFPRFAGR